MPNEEPKGPALPPKKSGDDDDEEDAADKKKLFRYTRNIFGETKAGKYLEIKGIIGATTGVSVMISYLIYNYYYYHYNIELNEMYFAMSAFGIFVLNGLLFTFFTNRIVKTLLLFTSVFHLVLDMIYIIVWVVYSKPYTNIKFSLFCGLGIGIIYWIYDAITSSSRRRLTIILFLISLISFVFVYNKVIRNRVDKTDLTDLRNYVDQQDRSVHHRIDEVGARVDKVEDNINRKLDIIISKMK